MTGLRRLEEYEPVNDSNDYETTTRQTEDKQTQPSHPIITPTALKPTWDFSLFAVLLMIFVYVSPSGTGQPSSFANDSDLTPLTD